jgi:putative transposase
VQTVLQLDPHGGALFVFRGRRGGLLKVLWWDGQGLCLFAKRLERGRSLWPQAKDGSVVLTPAQLSMLLEGIDGERRDDPPPVEVVHLELWFLLTRRTACQGRATSREIVAKLRQVDVLTSQGQGVAESIRSIGVSEVTYYRWRQEFGGLKSDQIKRLKELETENSRLRRAVSDLTLDKLILQEAARGNY